MISVSMPLFPLWVDTVACVNIMKWSNHNCFFFQMEGKGKYVFDIGCEQHGEYIVTDVVRIVFNVCTLFTNAVLNP